MKANTRKMARTSLCNGLVFVDGGCHGFLFLLLNHKLGAQCVTVQIQQPPHLPFNIAVVAKLLVRHLAKALVPDVFQRRRDALREGRTAIARLWHWKASEEKD